MIDFDKIVKKMWKQCWKVLYKSDIYEMIDPEKKQGYASRVDKIIYRLKADGVILSIKAWVYIIPDREDKKLNKIDLIEKYYYKLLKKYVSYYCGSAYYLSWRKALEIHLKNYEVPEKIYVVNRAVNKKVTFWNYEIIFKTLSGKSNGKKVNLYSKMSEYVQKKSIDSFDFKCANLELSLLESAIVSDNDQWLPLDLINKAIKKYSSVFQTSIFYEIGKYKYIMAFNRLKEISKNIDKDLYKVFLDVIKKNWGLFIGEWLRWF